MINNSRRCYQHMWGKKEKSKKKEEEDCFRYFFCFNIKGAWVWPNTSMYYIY